MTKKRKQERRMTPRHANINCLKSTIEKLEKAVRYVQSYQ